METCAHETQQKGTKMCQNIIETKKKHSFCVFYYVFTGINQEEKDEQLNFILLGACYRARRKSAKCLRVKNKNSWQTI